MSEKELIKLSVEGRTAVLTMDIMPDNRMDKHFFKNLHEKFQLVNNNKSIGAMVITSCGRHFSAGADVEDVKGTVLKPFYEGCEMDEILERSILRDTRLFRSIEMMDIPVIAAITGFCLGSGFELALACNIRICSSDSFFGCPELSFGIITGMSGSIRLKEIIGKNKTTEMLLIGDMIGAEEAYRMGLVNKVLKRKEVLPFAMELAHSYSKEERISVNRTIKKMVFEDEPHKKYAGEMMIS